MHNCNAEFNAFYKNYVVLTRDRKTKLHEKCDLNIERLKRGIQKYNEEHNTNLKVIEIQKQGSVRMSTVIQNDKHAYDIDVAVVFDRDSLCVTEPKDLRKLLKEAFLLEYDRFKKTPEVKNSCLRIFYDEGYHVDIAAYKKTWGGYEHAGVEWTKRELDGIEKWFDSALERHGEQLREVVRLFKMFVQSHKKKLPAGIVSTALVVESFHESDRLDVSFFYTVQNIVNRLSLSQNVFIPCDNYRSLTPNDKEKKKVKNLLTLLRKKLEKSKILFDTSAEQKDIYKFWARFFNHSFWFDKYDRSLSSNLYINFHNTEQFIEDLFPVATSTFDLPIFCEVTTNGFRKWPLPEFFLQWGYKFFPKSLKLRFYIQPNEYDFDEIYWKVRNVGPRAVKRNMIRGQIFHDTCEHRETTDFGGRHFVECYLIKNRVCIAKGRIEVPIRDVDYKWL